MKCLVVSSSPVLVRVGFRALAALALCSVCGSWSARAHAQQQVVVANLTYTANAKNTTNSEFRSPPLMGTPANWKAPIDYTKGKAYAHFQVIDKPSDAKTMYNVCFALANSKLSCMPLSPPFTGKGINNFNAPFSAFWQVDQVDWTMGVSQIVLVLKDGNGKLVQGDAMFYPATIRTVITLVPDGATYVPPKDPTSSDKTKDAGMPPVMPAKDAGTPTTIQDAGVTPSIDAAPSSRSAGASAAGSAAPPASAIPPAGSGSLSSAVSTAGMSAEDAGVKSNIRNYIKSGSNCTTLHVSSSPPSWMNWLTVACLVAIKRRRRR